LIKNNLKYKDKTKEQLINELAELHRRIEDLEAKKTNTSRQSMFVVSILLIIREVS